MGSYGRLHRARVFKQRIGHGAGRLLNCFPEIRSWLVENIYNGHPDLLVLRRNLERRIVRLETTCQPIQAQDQEWIKYLNGLEAGDFRDREVQDRQEYSNSTGYPDIICKVMDLENRLQQRIGDIDRLRRASPVVVPPTSPPCPVKQIPHGHSLNSDIITQSQAKDGSASAVPSTSGFLTGKGGSLSQADPSAPQKVGMDQLADDMPSPSEAHRGIVKNSSTYLARSGLPPLIPPIKEFPPGHSLKLVCHRSQQISPKDGSGFLTGNGGSLNQTGLNAHQEVGMDQIEDDIPSSSDAHLGLDDRKEPSQKQSSQEQLSQLKTSLQQPAQQQSSRRQHSQRKSPQQEQNQGMNPLPGRKLFSPQGQFSESSGQTGACSSPPTLIPESTFMSKPTRQQRTTSPPATGRRLPTVLLQRFDD